MILIFDIGNTRMKVCMADAEGISYVENWQAYLNEAEAVLVSNVAGEGALPKEVREHSNCKMLTWQSEEASAWLKGIPAGLGADRVAADIGARCMCPDRNLLIIDAGTCLTFDVIGKDGSCIGGSISPGINIRLKAMHDYTAALPLLDARGEHPVLGYDTPTAMRGGAINGMKWEIEGYIRHVLAMYPDLHVFVTGGDELEFDHELQEIITRDPLLIQKGLLAAFAQTGH